MAAINAKIRVILAASFFALKNRNTIIERDNKIVNEYSMLWSNK